MAQNDLFFDEELAVKELRSRGYRVVKENYTSNKSITKISDLIQFFYARRRFYNQDRKFPASIDYSEDKNYMSSFLASREKLGLDRQTALKEAADIIDGLFKYEKLLYLREPVHGAAILTVRPIVDRVCSFLNGEVAAALDLDNELELTEVNKYYNKNYSNRDADLAAEQRKRILENLK